MSKKNDDDLVPWSEWWLDFGPVIAGIAGLVIWILFFT